MTPDFRVLVSFHRHRKTRRLRKLLGSAGVDGLLGLWTYAAMYEPTGRLEDLTDLEVEEEALWTGTPGDLVKALEQVGYLDRDGDALVLHDWPEHQAFVTSVHRAKEEGRKGGIRSGEVRRAKRAASSNEGGSNTPSEPPSPENTNPPSKGGVRSPSNQPSNQPTNQGDDSASEVERDRGGDTHVATAPTTRGDRARALLPDAVPTSREERGAVARSSWVRMFDRFWSVYPRKVKRAKAEEAWLKLAPSDPALVFPLAETVANVLDERIRLDWRGAPRTKIPHASSFLNGERFEVAHGAA